MLADPDIHCVVPPWGGETAIDMVDLLDWDALAGAEPTWLVGYSDLSTLLVPVTTRLGWATLHGDNLADTPYAVPDGLLHWLDLVGEPGPFVQRDSGLVATWVRFEEDARATEWTHVGQGRWEVEGGGSLDVTGRLIGGCTETVANLAGTPYGDVRAWAEDARRAHDRLRRGVRGARHQHLPLPPLPAAGGVVRPGGRRAGRPDQRARPRGPDAARGGRSTPWAGWTSRSCGTSRSGTCRRTCRSSTGRSPGSSSTATPARSPSRSPDVGDDAGDRGWSAVGGRWQGRCHERCDHGPEGAPEPRRDPRGRSRRLAQGAQPAPGPLPHR